MEYHEQTKTLVFGPNEAIPPELANKDRTVPATFMNAIRLTACGFQMPKGLINYDFPCPPGQEPLYGQRAVTQFMLLNPRSFVLSDTRTGKSRPGAWAGDYLMSRVKTRIRALIVSDILALERTWAPEITRTLLGRRRFAILKGTVPERIRKLEEDVDFYLLNPEGLRIGYSRSQPKGLFAALMARPDIKIVIFDEATTYRNSRTIVSKAAQAISRKCAFSWALTGTPSPNGPLDVYGIKRLIHPDEQMSFVRWRDMVTWQRGPFLRIPKQDAPDHVAKLLSPAIRIPRDKVFEETELRMPEPIIAPLSDQQIELMRELKNDLVVMLAKGEVSAVNQAALRLKLIQIATGAVYDSEQQVHLIDARPRLELFDRIINQGDGKTIVFAPFISVVRMLAERYPERGLYMSSVLTRNCKVELLKAFQTSDKQFLFSHPGPVARGLDLTCADRIIWYAPIDRTEFFLQGGQRINGPEQTEIRHIIRIAGSEIESEIYRRLERNENLQGVILKLKELNLDGCRANTPILPTDHRRYGSVPERVDRTNCEP
ncbi:MAG: hypothetical protein C5B60_04775 [Chloroflexi bacterium]|nr:MAG: hypothetical protein C5B60_04775 [Chloroflexota bacterium]